jgi:hypothetical protein
MPIFCDNDDINTFVRISFVELFEHLIDTKDTDALSEYANILALKEDFLTWVSEYILEDIKNENLLHAILNTIDYDEVRKDIIKDLEDDYPEINHKRCSLCTNDVVGIGNNPHPLPGKQCCDVCNATKVIPARLEAYRRRNEVKN